MTHAVIIIGPPGAGKGTQAVMLSQFVHISTGALFREHIGLGAETELGAIVKGYLNAGQLVPDEITTQMLEARLMRQDCEGGVVLDGYPRNMDQVRALEAMFLKRGWYFKAAIELYVPEEAGGDQLLVDRLVKRTEVEGRADDNPETIAERMHVFRRQTQPVIDFYSTAFDTGHFFRVSCLGTTEEVHARILAALSIVSTPVVML